MFSLLPVPQLQFSARSTNGSSNLKPLLPRVMAAAVPNFTVVLSPSSEPALQGQTVSFTVTVTAVSGYVCPITLTTDTKPSIPSSTETVSPSQAEGSFTSILTVSVPAATPPGSYGVGVVGTMSGAARPGCTQGEVNGGGAVVVVGAASFTVALTPATLSVSQGSTGSFTVNVAAVGTFDQQVYLTAAMPSVTCGSANCFGNFVLTPNFGIPPFSATLSVPVNALTPTGSYQVTVYGQGAGQSGLQTASATAMLTVGAAGFSVSVSPSSIVIPAGQSNVASISVTATGGFNQPVTFDSPIVPSGLMATIGPTSGVPPFSAAVTIVVAGTVPVGTYSVSITARDPSNRVAGAVVQVTVPTTGFGLSASPSSATVSQGQSTSFTITVTMMNGFGGTVTLSASAPPNISLSTFVTPKTGTPPFSASLTVTVDQSVLPGDYSIGISGVSGSQTVGTAVSVTVTATDYSIALAPSSNTVAPGSSVTFTASVSSSGGFSNVVVLSVQGILSGFSAQLSQSSGIPPFTSTVTVSVSSSVSLGTYQIGVSGCSGSGCPATGSIREAMAQLVVALGDFSLNLSPTTLSAPQGSQQVFTVSTSVVGSWSGDIVSLIVTAPSNFTYQLSPTSGVPPFSASLLLNVPLNQQVGQYLVTVLGAARSISHQQTLTVTVTGSGFSVSVSPSAISMPQGSSNSFSVSVSALGSFSESVSLNVQAPQGFTSTLAPTFGTPPFTSSLLLTLDMNTPTGSYFVIVTGSGGGRSSQAIVAVTVTASGFTLSASPSSASMHQNTPQTFTVTASVLGAFNSPITLSLSSPPAGFSGSFAPASGTPTFTSTLTLVAALSVPDGVYAIIIQGSGGGRSAQTTLTITVGSPPPLTVTVQPSSGSIYQGATSTFTVKVNATGTLPVSVTLTGSAPSGLSVSLSPSSGNANFTSALIVGVSTSMAPGVYVVVVQASGGGLMVQSSSTITVQQSLFSISVTPSSATIAQSQSSIFTVIVPNVGPFSQPVTLTAVAGSDISATLGPFVGVPPYVATLLLKTTLSTPTGMYVVVVQGVGGTITVQAAITLTVTQSTFTLASSPASASIYQGQTATFTITATPVGAFSMPVSLTASSSSGISASIAPSTATPPFTSTLTVTTTLTSTTGPQTIVVTGSSGSLSVSTSVSVTVSPADFSLAVSPTSVSIYQTQSTNVYVTVSGNPYFGNTVTLSLTGGSGGNGTLSPSLSPTSGTPSFIADIFFSTTIITAPSTYTFTLQGSSSGGPSHSVTFTVTVLQKPPNYTVTVKTSGLTSGYTDVYVDGVDSGTQVSDNASGTFGPYDGLSMHTFSVQGEVLVGSTVKFMAASTTSQTATQQVTLTFEYAKYYQITWATDSAFPPGQSVTITVDGASYTDYSPISFQTWEKANGAASFSLVSPQTLTIEGRTYMFSKWVNSAGVTIVSPVTITKSDIFTVIWSRTQFMVTVFDEAGANVIFAGTTQTVPSEGSVTFWAKPGSYNLSTSQAVGSGGYADVFQDWRLSGGNSTLTSNPTTINVSSADITINVQRKPQVQLTIISAYGSPQGGGWYDKGAVASFSAEPVQTALGTRYACASYSGDASGTSCTGTIVMSAPKTLTFNWKLQYQLSVTSQYGTVAGAAWYDANVNAAFSVTAPQEATAKYLFKGWSGDYTGTQPSGTILMDHPKSVTALWGVQYLTSFIFEDDSGAQLTHSPESVIITGASGEQTLTTYGNVFLDTGAWTLKAVNYHGVNVAPQTPTTYTTAPGGNWTIRLRIYTLTVQVSGMIYGPAGAATVSTALPDGTIASSTADSSGVASFEQLPAGEYDVTAKTMVGSAVQHVTLTGSQALSMKPLTTTDAGIIAVLALVAVGGLTVGLRRRRTRKQSAHEAEPTSGSMKEGQLRIRSVQEAS